MRQRHDEIKATGASPLPFRPDRDTALGRLRELRGHWKPLSAVLDPETRAAGNVYTIEPAFPIEEKSGLLQTQGSVAFFKSGEGEGEGEPFMCVGEGCPLGFYDLTETFPTCAAPLATGHIAIDEIAETICIHITHTINDATYFAFHDSAGQVIEAHPIVGSTFDYQWSLIDFLDFEEDIDYITIQSATYPSGAVVGVLECPWFPEPVACSATLSAAGVTESAVVDFAMDMDVDTLALSMEVTHDLGGDAVLELLSVTGEVTQSFPAVPTGFTYAFNAWEVAALWQPGAFDTIRISGGTAEVSLSGAVSCIENLGDIYYCPIELDGDGAGTASPYTGSGYIVISLLSGYRGILLEHNVPDATEVRFMTDTSEAIVSLPLSGPTLETELTPCQWDMYVAGNVGSIRIATNAQPMGEIGGAILCDGPALALYSPGCITPVAVTIENPESAAIAALGLELSLPEGWSFIEVTGAAKPEDPDPALVDKTVPLLWMTPPSFPADFTLVLEAPVGASLGTQGFASYLRFFDANNSGLNIQTPPLRQLDHSLCLGALPQPVYAAAPPQDLGTPPADPQPCTPEVPMVRVHHSADQDKNNAINLSELLRAIQLFNAGGYHCATGTEDGYAPGVDVDARCCLPHSSDYNPQDWAIQLTELLRLVQFYNMGGYRVTGSWSDEDRFLPGPPPVPTTWQEEVEAFLEFIEKDASIESFDRNEYGFGLDSEIEFFPNGIPDGAEFAILQYLLEQDPAEFPFTRGINPTLAAYVWDHNYAQAATALGQEYADLPGWRFAVAAYMSMGDFGSVRFIRERVKEELGIVAPMKSNNFRLMLSDELHYERSPNKDPYSNLATWEFMDSDTTTNWTWEDFAAATTGAAPNPLAGLGGTGGGGAKQTFTISNCDPDCRVPVIVSVTNNLPSHLKDGAVSVSGEDAPGELTQFSYYWSGSPLKVTAHAPPGYVFLEWDADGTMIDGSTETVDSFNVPSHLNAIVQVRARFEPEKELTLYWTYRVDIWDGTVVDYGDVSLSSCSGCTFEIETLEPQINLSNYNLYYKKRATIRGPLGSTVDITVSPNQQPAPASGPYFATLNDNNFSSTPIYAMLTGTTTLPVSTAIAKVDFSEDPYTTSPTTYTGTAIGSGKVFFRISSYHTWLGTLGTLTTSGSLAAWAVPDEGHEFSHWVGCVSPSACTPGHAICCPPGAAWTVTPTHNNVRAFFVPKKTYTVTANVRIEGEGKDAHGCGGEVRVTPARKYYYENENVTLSALPRGYKFVRWEANEDHGQVEIPDEWSPSINLVVTDNISLTAVMRPDIIRVIVIAGYETSSGGGPDDTGMENFMGPIAAASGNHCVALEARRIYGQDEIGLHS